MAAAGAGKADAVDSRLVWLGPQVPGLPPEASRNEAAPQGGRPDTGRLCSLRTEQEAAPAERGTAHAPLADSDTRQGGVGGGVRGLLAGLLLTGVTGPGTALCHVP